MNIRQLLLTATAGVLAITMAVQPLAAAQSRPGRGGHGENEKREHRDQKRKPAQRPGNGNNRPAQRPGQNNNRPAQRPGQNNNRPAQRPGHDNNRPAQRPGQNNNRPAQRPGHDNNRPPQRPGHDNRPPQHKPVYRPSHQQPPHRPGHGAWHPSPPPHRPWRPVVNPWRPPVPPPAWRPVHRGPSFATVLGVALGTAIANTVTTLVSSGYNVDGYDNDVIYLRDINQYNYFWPDATMRYNTAGQLIGTEYFYTTPGYDVSRYSGLYNQMYNLYGIPAISSSPGSGALRATWFGPNQCYITIQYGPTVMGGVSRYCTTLTQGLY